MDKQSVKYITEEISQHLVGGKIVQAMHDEACENYGFIVQIGKRRITCWIDCDPEGNGPGFINIQK